MTFGDRLTELRKENGYHTRNEFAEKLGIPSTTLRNYETGVREPGHTFLKMVSEFFNVSVDYLLCLTDDKKVLNSFELQKSEIDMILKYRRLDSHGKDVVNTILQKEYNRALAAFPAPVLLNAAHERTDINVTSEMNKTDDDTMNNSDF